MPLLYIELIAESIREAFSRKVESIAGSLGIAPDWLMQVMWAESRLRPAAANRQGKDKHLVAAGLLQFTSGSGIVKAGKVPSLPHILKMPALAQLDLVAWYFSPYRGRMHSYFDVYAVTFFPAMIGKADDWVLQSKNLPAETIARQNPAIARGKARITVADFKRYTKNIVPASLHEKLFGTLREAFEQVAENTHKIEEVITSYPKESAGIGAGIIAGACLLGWVLIKKDF